MGDPAAMSASVASPNRPLVPLVVQCSMLLLMKKPFCSNELPLCFTMIVTFGKYTLGCIVIEVLRCVTSLGDAVSLKPLAVISLMLHQVSVGGSTV